VASCFGEINSFNGVLKGSWIEIPLGPIQNNQYPIGTEVNIVIRPDRLKSSQEKIKIAKMLLKKHTPGLNSLTIAIKSKQF